jgi:arginine decarboxylase
MRMDHLDQHSTPLVDQLRACAESAAIPFHTPGHKKGVGVGRSLQTLLGPNCFRADLPELPELDNLFAPQGVIQAAQDLAAAAFGADRTWFLTNGSTAGILAAILATCGPGDKIILPRNSHLSAIHGLILSGAEPVFVAPDYDATWDMAHSLAPAAVATALHQHPDAKAVMMVSPTYYGTGGPVAEIAKLAHAHGIPLLVDEAHGAHFAFHADLPTTALAAGADVAVQSIHKTLSALTQAAMVHLRGDRVSAQRLAQALQVVQSTSPSYLLLASLDAARQQMATAGPALMEKTIQWATWGRSQLQTLPQVSVLTAHHATIPGFTTLDPTRLTVAIAGMDGFTLDEQLHQRWGITVELPSLGHVTLIVSLGNTQQDMETLVASVRALVAERGDASANRRAPVHAPLPAVPMVLSPREAYFAATETVPIAAAIDRISAELICPYPPGIPVVMPGERVTAGAIAYLQAVQAAGGTMSGCADPQLARLRVVRSA